MPSKRRSKASHDDASLTAPVAPPPTTRGKTQPTTHPVTPAATQVATPAHAAPPAAMDAATSAPTQAATPAPQPAAHSSMHDSPHRRSAERAAQAFANFNLSKFAKGEVPANYVAAKKVADAKVVRDTHKALIRQQLQTLLDADPRNPGVRITIPFAKLDEVTKALPGIGAEGGEVKLETLLTYLRERMNGTSFYARGNPVMQRLAADAQARSQAKAIIEHVKNGSRNALSLANKGAPKS